MNFQRVGLIKLPHYHAADVMVSVSSNDSLPYCMLESMACGTPVVMGDIPQIREWIKDGENGFLIPPRDPARLDECIVKTFTAPENRIDGFIKYNIEMVKHEVDSRIVPDSIKNLVRSVAMKANNSD